MLGLLSLQRVLLVSNWFLNQRKNLSSLPLLISYDTLPVYLGIVLEEACRLMNCPIAVGFAIVFELPRVDMLLCWRLLWKGKQLVIILQSVSFGRDLKPSDLFLNW